MDNTAIIDFATMLFSHSDENLREILSAIYQVESESTEEISTVTKHADPRLQQPHSKVLLGMDSSQMISAEMLRASGGASMIDAFTGLDHPSTVSTLLLPPQLITGMFAANSVWTERHLKTLLRKHRLRIGLLKTLYESEDEDEQDDQPPQRDENQAADILECVARMLDVFEALVLMRDYSLSRMGQFFKG
jgi:hypothetical protein